MQVYKFGGASIADPDRMQALWPIIRDARQPLVLVVSALGKTTNALEEIVQLACENSLEAAHNRASQIERQHLDFARVLLRDEYFVEAKQRLNLFYAELERAIDDARAERFDYSYDQIVCMGELLSTTIMAIFLKQQQYDCDWVDVRDVIRTDANHRDARIDEELTRRNAEEILSSILSRGRSVLTQGFIGSTDQNTSVTLGREGSDYTAGVLGSMLNCKAVTIWKDVEGLKNADPRVFSNTVKIEAITYHEVIEMAYYGAQVVHPKTIKPLQNKGIPLFIRCFLFPKGKGTIVHNEVDSMFYPPLIVLKKNQLLMQFTTKDFSFITEDNLRHLYATFSKLHIHINLIQNAAISFIACFDNDEEKVSDLVQELETDYSIFQNENVELLTVRHYNMEVVQELKKSRFILLEQKTRHTLQLVLK